MIFPELADRAKGWLESRGGTPTLGLKGISGFEDNAEWYQRNGFYSTAANWRDDVPSWSGETVTTGRALNHSVVFACNRIIAESAAFLPLALMQRKGDAKRNALDHPIYSALHDEANDETGAMEFRETRTSHSVLGGNGFARIVRRSGTGTALQLRQLAPDDVRIDRDRQQRLVYVVRESPAASTTYTVEPGKPQDILHLRGIGSDGVRGYSVLTIARQSIGTALSTERNVGRFYANGGRLPYNLKIDKDWKNDQDAEKFRADWKRTYSNPHEAPILPPWLTYEKTGISMADAQMLETRQFTVPELCRWFNISPHMVADLSRATFSNIEQLALEFVKFTLGAWLTRWEQALRRCVLTPEEKTQGYYFKHNVNALLRGDFVSRMAGYASALQNGHLNQDEVRDFEDMNPLPNGEGEHYRVQLNMQTLTADGITPDPAATYLAKLSSERKAA